jgi:hypothetical protein
MVAEFSCHWAFSGRPDVTFNYAAEFERDSTYKATTLPGLGLIETFDGLDGFAASIDTKETNRRPWDRFKSYVHYLNQESPDTTSYKVLYITRHGLGYHNAFKAQVGSDAWNVSALPEHKFKSNALGSLVAPRRGWGNHLGGFEIVRIWEEASYRVG